MIKIAECRWWVEESLLYCFPLFCSLDVFSKLQSCWRFELLPCLNRTEQRSPWWRTRPCWVPPSFPPAGARALPLCVFSRTDWWRECRLNTWVSIKNSHNFTIRVFWSHIKNHGNFHISITDTFPVTVFSQDPSVLIWHFQIPSCVSSNDSHLYPNNQRHMIKLLTFLCFTL